MSKKDKSKFRKRVKAEILNQMQSTQSVSQGPISQVVQNSPAPTNEVASTIEKSAPTASIAELDSLKMIKTDLKKSAIIITSILIVIVALYFIDAKTNFLSSLGSQIFKVLHINA